MKTVFIQPVEPLPLDLTAARRPGSAGQAMIAWPETPARDLNDLTQRYKLACGERVPGPPAGVAAERPGDRRTFTIVDIGTRRTLTRTATLRAVTPSAYWYVQDGQPLNEAALAESARIFEEQIRPTDRRYFGEEPEVGPNGDPHTTIFYGAVPSVGGYFNSPDMYPKSVNAKSNERKMIFVDGQSYPLNSEDLFAVLAHEFQHMIHWNMHPHSPTWVNEGMSELAMKLNGFSPGAFPQVFANNPDTGLTSWAANPSEASAHYGGAFLFLDYFGQRWGTYEVMKDLLRTPGEGPQMFDNFLARAGRRERFNDYFQDWLVANYVNEPSLDGGRYAYDGAPKLKANDVVAQAAARPSTVEQYGVRYIDITLPGDLEIEFQGIPTGRLFAADPHSGNNVWWSNRGDQMDTTLTRPVDLRGVGAATLKFWAWYDLEEDYDYAYVAVSDDDGCTWKTLATKGTTSVAGVLGGNLGNGFTGTSGGGVQPVWVEQTADLTPWAGKRVLLRFESVTDDAYNGPGFAVDDISIPEIGWADDAEADGDWQARGFYRGGTRIPQPFGVRLIKFAGDRAASVESVPLDENQHALIRLDGVGREVSRATLVVTGLDWHTTEPAQFRYAVRPRS